MRINIFIIYWNCFQAKFIYLRLMKYVHNECYVYTMNALQANV